MPLTDTAVRGVKPADKPQKLFDGNGLFLYVAPSGTKSWRLKYRFQGREKLLTLGTYPQLSLKEAREACAAAKKQLGGGIDPSVQKKVIARAWENTFEAIARGWHENKKSAWSERYTEDVLERIASNIFPYLGNRPINEITPPELLSVLRKIEARGAFYQANRLRESCSLVFRYAIATGRAERDTAADLRGALKSHVTTSRRHHRTGGSRRPVAGHRRLYRPLRHQVRLAASGADLSSPWGSALGRMVGNRP
ncbi:integrase arm-type DNA-binding domain-containing protein [Desulfovibrio sp.]|uniref:tyrosine-type recombinase/integrase n=1 Tax=Desulfovibrio sp. TaxID=885 RepID=UPI0025C61B55|nr:integrase arm-type DNA-binding domain-containing protein [Desulfovibrio sp.]